MCLERTATQPVIGTPHVSVERISPYARQILHQDPHLTLAAKGGNSDVGSVTRGAFAERVEQPDCHSCLCSHLAEALTVRSQANLITVIDFGQELLN